MATKTYRYKLDPALGIPTETFATEPTATEISGGPYTVDWTLDEAEKFAMDEEMQRRGWSFVQEVV